MTDAKGLKKGLFEGQTINTPSMLCVEDCLNTLRWVESIRGLSACIARTQENFAVLESWVGQTHWIDFVAQDPESRARTAVCFQIIHPFFQQLPEVSQRHFLKKMGPFRLKKGRPLRS